ncbi:MAG: hypothetical protein JSR99_09940 [Proteobacteria bacterium]|nr:hypothetical protein [Pseudomonadota bacterium]
MKLDDHHREGRAAAERRNRIELGLESGERGWWGLVRPLITSRLTVWAIVIGGLLGLASGLPL